MFIYMENTYWLWYKIAFALEIISIIIGLTYLSSTRAKNLEKIWLFYSIYRWKFVEWKKSWTFSKIIWIILTLLINPFFSWIDILFRAYSYINILVQKLSTPEKLKEIQYKLWASILTKEEVRELLNESANFLWKTLTLEQDEEYTLTIDENEYRTSEITLSGNKIYTNSHPNDYLSDFNRIYEYKIEWFKIYQRLLEDKIEHAGDKEYYDVKDWVILESDITERFKKSKLLGISMGEKLDEKMEKLKKACEWNELTFYKTKYFILSKHSFPKQWLRNFFRSELERIKSSLTKVKEQCAKHNIKLDYIEGEYIESNGGYCCSTTHWDKFNDFCKQAWCDVDEIQSFGTIMTILNWYLNDKWE